MKNRVAVTGIGVVSPLGIGIEKTWEGIINKESAVSKASFEGSKLFHNTRCGSVPEFNCYDYISNTRLLKLMNRESLLAAVAAKLAIDDAHPENFYSPESMGLYLGSGLTSGDLDYLLPLIENSQDADGNFSYEFLGRKALPACNPLLSFKILPNMALSYISILFNIKGSNMAFNPWPGNTAQAIGEAMRAIQYGRVNCALAGGCDSKNHFVGYAALSNLLMHSEENSGSDSPKELILSEGSSVIILENYEMAVSRGARVYAELAGYNTLTDSVSNGYFSAFPQILSEVMENTINDAGLEPDNVDAVISGIVCGAEAAAIIQTFNNKRPLITGTKHLTGDMLAANPPFDISISSYSLCNGGMPALYNSTNRNFALKFSSDESDIRPMETILINSFEPGSAKTSLLIRKAR